MIFSKVLSIIEERIKNEYDMSSFIKHKGERGRQREGILRTILDDFLPESYGVATGEIITFRGEKASPQTDIIIYDKLNMPIIGKSSSLQQVPLEAACAVIEVKSVLNSAALNDASSKFQKIREMPRCRYHYPVKEHMRRGPIFYAFGFTSKVTLETCSDFIADNSVDEDTSCFALDKGVAFWLSYEESLVPIHLDLKAGENSYSQSLSFFISLLLNDLQFIDIGLPKFTDLILSEE